MSKVVFDASISPGLTVCQLSMVSPQRRMALIAQYSHDVYGPAFPDESIREDPAYWLGLLNAKPYPAPPQPLIDVVFLLDRTDQVIGGVTVELYRTANCGLLTYISVAPGWRGRGIGRHLVRAARATLDTMGGPEVLMYAETERLDEATGDAERSATILRQKQLTALGARWVTFDYVMPPLRPGGEPHRLHLLVFDPGALLQSIASARIASLMRELAAALSVDLLAHVDTKQMILSLDIDHDIPIQPLPAVTDHAG